MDQATFSLVSAMYAKVIIARYAGLLLGERLKKGFFVITLSLLLIGISTFAIGTQLVETEVIRWTESYYLLEDSGANADLNDVFQCPISQRVGWNLSISPVLAEEWYDLLLVDDDSAELIVGLDEISLARCSELMELIRSSGGELVNTVPMNGCIHAVVADIPLGAVSAFALKALATGLPKFVEPNVRFQADLIPDDPGWPMQWGSRAIEADFAWNTTVGDSSFIVAVIDSGIDLDHEDLALHIVPRGFDWVNNDADPTDDNGHGTHCAGIIAAVLDNSIGIAGLAQVKLLAEKVLDSDGSGSADSVANAIIHAVNQGANILSVSLGSYAKSTLIYEAIRYADAHDVLIIGSAGNDASRCYRWPAAYEEVIGVTATGESDEPAEFTNFGDWIDVAAPGVNIYSTWKNNGYRNASGTSMSVPQVAGVAGLVWSQFPNMTRDQVRAQLRCTADDLGDPAFDEYYGHGLINARRAVEQPPPEHEIILLRWKIPYTMNLSSTAIINGTLLNFGTSNESNMVVQLFVNGAVEDSKLISNLTEGTSITTSHRWTPTGEGTYNVTLHVAPVYGETATQNNILSENIIIRTSQTFEVPQDFPTIQDAINKVDEGSTIQVDQGTYYEHLVVAKSITAQGENSSITTIDGNGVKSAIIVLANNISISGFTVQNSGGIILSSSHNNISANKVRDHFYGIALLANHNTLVGNTVLDCAFGILLEGSNGNTLRENHMVSNALNLFVSFYGTTLSHYVNDIDASNTVDERPVYYWVNKHDESIPSDAGYVAVLNSTGIVVRDLNLTKNGQGVLLVSSTNTTVANVHTSANHIGIYLVNSDYNRIFDNVAAENIVGIWLASNCTGNVVEANTTQKGTFGIALTNSSHNSVEGNTVSDNEFSGGWGIALEHSNCNSFVRNNVINNSVQVSIAFESFNNSWDNGYAGNYWSNYDGSDIDGDGIGDSPYVIDGPNSDNYPLMNRYWNPADVNYDLKVDIYDVVLLSGAYGTTPSDDNWYPHCDMVEPYGRIDIYDVVRMCGCYGDEYTP